MPLPRKTSLHARQVIQKAFKDLERAVAVPDARRFRTTTIQDVQEACENIENELGSRGLLRNMGRLEPLLKGLNCYAKAVETLCQGTPYLPWIWAPITVILKIGCDCIAAFEILIKAYAKIGKSLGRFELLRGAFADDAGFQEIVAIFYRDILKFHESAYKFVTANGWKVFFQTTWGRFDRHFNVILENLEHHGQLIDQEANARNIADTHALIKQLEVERKEKLDNVQAKEKQEIAKQYQAILARLQINESDQSSIRDMLDGALRDGHEGTCEWMLKHDKFKSWLNEKGDVRSLWLQGPAGTGKSVMAANLIKFRLVDNHIVLRHFCNNLYESSTRYEQILGTVIRQLLERSDDSIAYVYKTLILERKPLAVSTLETTIQELVSIISGSAHDSRTIWIVMDGVDACIETGSLARLQGLMDSIATRDKSPGAAACKVLFTSRHEPHEKQARRRATVLLSKEQVHIKAAIQLYVVHRLQSPRVLDRLTGSGVGMDEMTELGHQIAAKADGMFLYARLIIDYLSAQLFRTPAAVRAAVQELPPELKGFYRKILSDLVSRLNQSSTESVRCILQWVAFAKCPLRRLELLSAVTFSEGVIDIDRLVGSYFLQDCASIIEEKHDETVGFIHASVKEFLIGPDSPLAISPVEAQRQETVGMLTCLASASRQFAQPDDQKTRLRVVRGVFAFLNYATKHWDESVISHAEACLRSGTSDPGFNDIAESFANDIQKFAVFAGATISVAESLDPRLESLQNVTSIRPFIQMAMKSRSPEAIDEDFDRSFADPVGMLFRMYRDIVRSHLREEYHAGVSRDEFEQFKAQSLISLFTCRIPLCPSASVGYDTEAELQEHELEHGKRFPCREEGCHYPPFPSSRSLGSHIHNYHGQTRVPRRNLRRVGDFCQQLSLTRQNSSRIPPVLASQAPASTKIEGPGRNFLFTHPTQAQRLPGAVVAAPDGNLYELQNQQAGPVVPAELASTLVVSGLEQGSNQSRPKWPTSPTALKPILCTSLGIGTWLHMKVKERQLVTLVVFYSSSTRTISYYIKINEVVYTIEYSFSHIKDMGIGTLGDIVITLTQPPNFFVETKEFNSDNNLFHPTHDFTEDQQATSCLVHCLGGVHSDLQKSYNDLISVETFPKRRQPNQEVPAARPDG